MRLRLISRVRGSILIDIPQKFIRRVRFILFLLISAPYEKRISAILKQRLLFSNGLQSVFSVSREKQWINGVYSWEFIALTSAPFSARKETTSRLPAMHAAIKGVNSFSIVAISRSIDSFLSKNWTISDRPKNAAHVNGLMSSSRSVLGWASSQFKFF